jgi:hypothetical protein
MSAEIPPKGHRHSRSAGIPATSTSLHNPQNHFNAQAYNRNNQSEMNYPVQPSTPPLTPRRDNQHATQNTSNSNTQENGSKHKSRNKNRPKNVMTSPAAAVMRNDRSTPPLISAQTTGVPSSTRPINTPSTAAYAGPTFHASPAPSALPMPSFFSKSVPESPGMKGSRSLKEGSPSSNLSTPLLVAPPSTQVQREESPLDIFFKADREEKARARSASSTQASATTTGPFEPPLDSSRSSRTPGTPQCHKRSRERHTSKASMSGMFTMELEGENPRTPIGPAFSTPYSERISAARSAIQTSRPLEQSSLDPQHSLDRSEALKAYLFSNHPQPSLPASNSLGETGNALSSTSISSRASQTPSAPLNGSRSTGLPPQQSNYPFSHDSKPLHSGPRASGRTSGLRQEVTPTKTPSRTPDCNSNYANSPTPSRVYGNTSSSDTTDFLGNVATHTSSPAPSFANGVSTGNRSTDIQGIENSLRKILKLDSSVSSGITSGNLPAATASVPNYVGGRPPPMNGMHNGVTGS